MFSINDMLRNDAEDKSYHVLWLDYPSDLVYVITEDKGAFPIKYRISELEEQVRTGMVRLETESQAVLLPESEIPNHDKAFRDEAWNTVEPLVINEPAIYDRKQRSKMVKEAANRTGHAKTTIYNYSKRP